jgi:hypothetical protein
LGAKLSFLQPVLIVVGLGIAGLPFLPSLRRWFEVTADSA